VPDTSLTDPLGRIIVLHNHTWYGHILKRHPEMRPYRVLVEQAVSNPLEIRISDADADSRLYFAAGPRQGIMVAVVADVSRGFVRTAHLVRTARGAIEWSPPTP